MENQNLKFDFVFLGQSVLKYQVPLDIFHSINQIYESNYNNLYRANKQLVGKIESEHSLFYAGADETKMKRIWHKNHENHAHPKDAQNPWAPQVEIIG